MLLLFIPRGAPSETKTLGTAQNLPSARYLLKLADAQDHVTAYIVRQLQEQGFRCIVDENHIIGSADDEKLKLQARIQYYPVSTYLIAGSPPTIWWLKHGQWTYSYNIWAMTDYVLSPPLSLSL